MLSLFCLNMMCMVTAGFINNLAAIFFGKRSDDSSSDPEDCSIRFSVGICC